MYDNQLTSAIIGAAIRVHNALGPGLLESVYENCLCHELKKANLSVEKQKPVPLIYEAVKMECGYRIDLLVESRIVIEIKSVESLNNVHLAQTLTYLRLADLRLGLLLNFNVTRMTDGIRRVVNNY